MGGDGEALRHSGVTQKRDMPDEVRATYGTSLVFAHLLINIVHGTAHLKLQGGFLGYPPLGSLHTRTPGLLHFHGHRHAPLIGKRDSLQVIVADEQTTARGRRDRAYGNSVLPRRRFAGFPDQIHFPSDESRLRSHP